MRIDVFLTRSAGTATWGLDILEQPFEVKKRIGFYRKRRRFIRKCASRVFEFVGRLRGPGSDLRSRVDIVRALCDRRREEKLLKLRSYRQRVRLAQAIIQIPRLILVNQPRS